MRFFSYSLLKGKADKFGAGTKQNVRIKRVKAGFDSLGFTWHV